MTVEQQGSDYQRAAGEGAGEYLPRRHSTASVAPPPNGCAPLVKTTPASRKREFGGGGGGVYPGCRGRGKKTGAH